MKQTPHQPGPRRTRRAGKPFFVAAGLTAALGVTAGAALAFSGGDDPTAVRTASSAQGAAAPDRVTANGPAAQVGQAAAKPRVKKAKKTKKAVKPAKAAATGAFSPYVDGSLYPAYDLVDMAKKTGVKQFNLAFITSGGGCTPKWGGVTDLGGNTTANQTDALRKLGGDVRVSFGGASGSELGLACSDAASLEAAYGKVIDQFKLTKVDFDIEGGALPDTAANTRRAKAIAALQKKHAGLDVSFTLPELPSGLTQDGVNLVKNAKANGVSVSAVNVMAMDYGDSAAPNPNGKMGQYAIDAATATQGQIKGALGLSDAEAWKRVAVTPMIGVNDVNTEVFTVADASKVASFAKSKGLAWTAMWSATRDKACPGGPKNQADPTCSSIDQQPFAFMKAFG